MSSIWPMERVSFARQAIDQCADVYAVHRAVNLLAGPPLTVAAVRKKLAAMRAAIREAGGIVPEPAHSRFEGRMSWSPSRRKLAFDLIAAHAPHADIVVKLNELPGLPLKAVQVSKRIFEFKHEIALAEEAAVARAKLKREFDAENARLKAIEIERTRDRPAVVVRRAPAEPERILPLRARRPRDWDSGFRMGMGE